MKYKRKFYSGSTGDIKNLERHFSLMAEKGWMIDNIGTFFHRYKSTTPCKLRFYVDILPQIGAFDYPDNENAQDYRSLCEEAGWKYVTADRGINVFYTETDAEPIPLHTDNRIQNRIFLKHYIKYELLLYSIMLLLLLFVSLPLSSPHSIPFADFATAALLNDFLLFATLGFPILIIGLALQIFAGIIWLFRTLYALKRGFPLPVTGYRTGRAISGLLTAGIIILILCVIIGIILDGSPALIVTLAINLSGVIIGSIFRYRIKTKKNDKGTNILQFVGVLIGAAILSIIVNISIIPQFHSFDWWTPNPSLEYRAAIMGDRPIITLDALGIEPGPNASFLVTDEGGSIAVPVSYLYREDDPVSSALWNTVSTRAHRTRHNIIAYLFFRAAIAPFETLEGYHRMDEDEAALWGADEGVLVYTERFLFTTSLTHIPGTTNLILLQGQTVLHVMIAFDDAEFDIELLRYAVLDVLTN